MHFAYTKYEIAKDKFISRPTLPVTLRYEKIEIPVVDALVDTGADYTILPLEFAIAFGFTFDLEADAQHWQGAGGNSFPVFPSPKPIRFIIPAQRGFRSIEWEGGVFFTLKQPTILLGHRGCLEKLNLLFKGKQKILEVSAAS